MNVVLVGVNCPWLFIQTERASSPGSQRLTPPACQDQGAEAHGGWEHLGTASLCSTGSLLLPPCPRAGLPAPLPCLFVGRVAAGSGSQPGSAGSPPVPWHPPAPHGTCLGWGRSHGYSRCGKITPPRDSAEANERAKKEQKWERIISWCFCSSAQGDGDL